MLSFMQEGYGAGIRLRVPALSYAMQNILCCKIPPWRGKKCDKQLTFNVRAVDI